MVLNDDVNSSVRLHSISDREMNKDSTERMIQTETKRPS